MAQRSNKFVIFPLVKIDGQWSIPDEVLLGVWQKMEQEGKIKDLFYDGTIKTPFEWMEFIKRRGTFPVLVVHKETNAVVHIAWLNQVFDIGAWAHHCSVGPYQRGAWEAVRDFWDHNFPQLRLLLGTTPITNERAVKFLKKICKFTVVGPVPQMCRMAYEDGKRVPGIVSYYEFAR